MKKTNMSKTALYSAISIATLITTTSWAANVPVGTKLAPAKDQVLTIANGAEPQSIDPQLIQGVPGSIIGRDMFEGLTREDTHGKPIPGIAKSWTVSRDGKTYTFHLRHAKWSDGPPVTARDFVFAWRRAIDPKTNSQYAWFIPAAGITNAQAIIDGKKPLDSLGVKALNDYTLQVTLDHPVPYFLEMAYNATMWPVPEKIVKKYGRNWLKPGHMASDGAYKLQSWVVNGHITLVRNKNYWDNKDTIINKVTYLPTMGDNAINRYKANQAQILDPEVYISTQQFNAYKKNAPQEVKVAPGLGIYYYDFNVEKAPFNNINIRKALSYAINRDTIAKYVWGQGVIPAYGFLPPSISHYAKPDFPYKNMTQAQRNAKAKALLQKAGYGPSHPLHVTIMYNTLPLHKKMAVAISQMWQALGVDARIENQEWKTFLTTRQEGQYKIARDGWNGDYNDPSDFMDLLTTGNAQNNSRWSNKKYDALIAKADKSLNPKERSSLYKQAQEIMIKDMPIAPIFYYTTVALVKPDVKGYATTRPDSATFTREMYIVKKHS